MQFELSGVHAESGIAAARAAVLQHDSVGLLDDDDDELLELDELESDELLELDDELLELESDELLELDDELLLDDDELLDSELRHRLHVVKKPSTSDHVAVLCSVVGPLNA